jgi:hypothetical protein
LSFTESIPRGDIVTFTLDVPQTIVWLCTIHPEMTGTIEVASPSSRRSCPRLDMRRGLPAPTEIGLPKHPNEHRPQRPILLAVDQQLESRSTVRALPIESGSIPPQ